MSYFNWIYFKLGLLQQLSNRTLVCDDQAVFICINDAQNYLHWNILTKQGQIFLFGFSLFLNSPLERSGPESSSIKAEVNFVNSSFIISTVTFLRASKLNGTSITCDEETIVFAVSPPDTGAINCVWISQLF